MGSAARTLVPDGNIRLVRQFQQFTTLVLLVGLPIVLVLAWYRSGTLTELRDTLDVVGARIEEGPVERVGGRDDGRAVGTSIYTRDPDGNLLEFIVYGGAA
jgi:catechol 2,3-dioxygenase-like lactoylglutathione lyase family enzyme